MSSTEGLRRDFETQDVAMFVEGLAEKLGGAVKASTIFGEPIERHGVTVIPVARARWGFGGGGGRKGQENGRGGGGGAQVSPVGFIVLRNGGAEFQRIRPIPVSTVLAGALAGMLVVRALRRR